MNTVFADSVKLATAPIETGVPFSYLFEMGKEGVWMSLTTGVFARAILIQENVSNLALYLRDLVRLKFSSNIEAPVKTSIGTVTFGIYNSGTHPGTELPVTTAVFRVTSLYIPLTHEAYIYRFLTDLDHAMSEYFALTGATCIKTFEVPSVKVTGEEYLTVTVRTPRLDATMAQQTALFGRYNLIGFLDMLYYAEKGGMPHLTVRQDKIHNTLTGSSSQKGWVYNCSNAVVVNSTECKLYIDAYMLPLLIDALKTFLETKEGWKAGIFSGEEFENASIYNGSCYLGKLSNPFPKPKEEVKKEVETETKPKEEVKTETKPKEEVKTETKPKEEVKTETKPVPEPEAKPKKVGKSVLEAHVERLKYPLVISGYYTRTGCDLQVNTSYEMMNWANSFDEVPLQLKIWSYLFSLGPKQA